VGIRERLLVLAMGVAVPLALVGLVGLLWMWTDSRRQLDLSVERQAELAAAAFQGWLDAQRQPLVTIAASVAAESRQPPLSRADLRFFVTTRPHWAALRILDASGETLFSHPENAEPLSAELAASLLEDLQRSDAGAVEMDWRLRGGRPVLAIASPVEGGGAVVARVDAGATGEIFDSIELPAGADIAVLDPQGRLIYRSQTPPSSEEHEVDGLPLLNALGDQPTVVAELASPFDATRRVYGLARAGATGCVVAVGVPSAVLYEPAREQLAQYVLFSLAALACAAAASLILARGIARPVLRLRDAANRLGAGDLTARAPVLGKDEIAQLARAFNGMAESIEERDARLTELDRLKSEFVGSVSHELRTPLTTIKTLTRVLLRGGQTEAERREYLQAIAAECDRQIDLVLNLLDLSRIEAGAYSLAPAPTDVAEIVNACLAIERHAAEARGHELEADLPPDLPDVLADRVALRRVLCSLIENAFKYTEDGGRVTVSARAAGSEVAIAVTDTGAGIAPEDLPHIFEKFYRGRPHGATGDAAPEAAEGPGVGLGLYLARTIVEHLGGRVEVHSEVGRGSTFTLYLPALGGAEPAAGEDFSAETLAHR
jgi:signal transduction histidine kinase